MSTLKPLDTIFFVFFYCSLHHLSWNDIFTSKYVISTSKYYLHTLFFSSNFDLKISLLFLFYPSCSPSQAPMSFVSPELLLLFFLISSLSVLTDPATIYFLPSCSHSHAKLCVSLDYCYFYFYLFCLFGWIPPLFIFYSFVLSLPCKTLSLSRLLLLLFLSILSFWTDPSTIYFLLLRAFPPMQDFVSLPIIIIFILFSFVFLDGPWHYFFFTPCSPSHAELWVS